MSKKIVFIDIDGTLTTAGSNIPPDSALDAIRRAQEKGHIIFLCTGRNFNMLQPLLKYDFDGAIGSSGGYIFETSSDDAGMSVYRTIYDHPMSEADRVMLLDVLRRNGIFRTVECRDNSYTDEGFKRFLEEHQGEGGNSELLRWRKQIEESLNILPMSEYRGEPVYKTVIMCPDERNLEEPIELLSDDFNLVIQDRDRYGIINGEIQPKDFNKGTGVRLVAEHFGIPLEDTIGFGDSNNDREMLETVGLSIVMDNGTDSMKRLADEITDTVENDGLYKAFSKHGLI